MARPMARDAFCVKHHYQEQHNASVVNYRNLYTSAKMMPLHAQLVLDFLRDSVKAALVEYLQSECICVEDDATTLSLPLTDRICGSWESEAVANLQDFDYDADSE